MKDYQEITVLDYVKKNVLLKDEEIVWKGKPDPSTSSSREYKSSMFAVFIIAFAAIWTTLALQGGAVLGVLGIPLFLYGIWCLLKPRRIYKNAQNTYYAITNQRVIILTTGSDNTVVTIVPSEITHYEQKDKMDGTGDIQLRETVRGGQRSTSASVEFTDGLWGISDIKGASEAIGILRLQK